MLRNTVLLFFFNFILQSIADPVPHFITPCKADNNECLLASIKRAQPFFIKGIPELGVPSTDPLAIRDVSSNGNNLKLDFKNMKVFGLGKCDVLEAKRDAKAEKMSVVLECPIKLIGKYVANGKILFLEILGDGDVEIEIEKIKLSLNINLKTIDGDDGQKHWKFSGLEYTYEFEERAHIQLTNLFGGDETKSKPVLEAVNAGWKEMIPQIGEPLIQEIATQIILNVNIMFKKVPKSELEIY